MFLIVHLDELSGTCKLKLQPYSWGGLPRRQAQCAQEPGGARPGAVRPDPGAISRESLIDKNGAVSQIFIDKTGTSRERDPAKGKDKVRD
ncbi:hypothetical protein L2E82_31619 [Cichorium intybus]|uniref:Uncharacterized protein n=1 Tax=Cichorium intybus TaxID=13427 RepID=A0ACB9BEX4_CICIN|nr:hypothetical protein L2E82_31619 [Cichorium intybus]